MTAVSRELEERAPGWDEKVKRAFRLLKKGDEIGKRMEVVGEEGTSLEDMVLYLKSELYDFAYLQQNAFDKEDSYCPLQRQIDLFNLISHIIEKKFHFTSHDEARQHFLRLQNQIKNMNFLAYDSEHYSDTHGKIVEALS